MTATEATHTAVLNGGRRLLRAQYELLISNAWIKAAVGGYGSGKTAGAAATFLRNCIVVPMTEVGQVTRKDDRVSQWHLFAR